MKRNKKGSIQDLLWIGISLLILSIVILIAFKVSNEINTHVQESDLFESEGKTALGKINNMYPGIIDNSFLFVTIALSLGALMLAALVRIHPIFIALFIIVLAIIIFLSAIFSNIYQEIANNPDMILIAEQLTFTHQIMSTLPILVGVIGSILAIIMYKTFQSSGGL